jgi:Flp pilus assembly protein TadB
MAETTSERLNREMADRQHRQQQADLKQQQTILNDRAREYRRAKDTAAFNATLASNVRTAGFQPRNPTVDYSTGSYQSGRSGSSGIGIASVVAVVLTIILVCAVAHGASLIAIGKVAVMGVVALAAMAILAAVLAFIRDHFFGIAVIVGAAIYAWVHYHG